MVDIFNQALDLINKGGVVALLIVAVWALATERVIPGSRYTAVLKRVEELEFRLDRQTSTTDKAISAAEVATRAVATQGSGG